MVKDLTDNHLANVIHHIQTFMRDRKPETFYIILLEEVIHRGLDRAFLGRAPYPFKDADGQWKTFDKKTLNYKTVRKEYA